jgi:multidrug transporter EmrE-like cation transporter
MDRARLAAILAANVVLTVLAQSLLRAGMRRVGEGSASLGAAAARAVVDTRVLGGVLTFGGSLLLWLWLLSKMRISVVYPLQQSLVFIALQFVAWRWLGEGWSPTRLAGVLVVCVGVFLLARG